MIGTADWHVRRAVFDWLTDQRESVGEALSRGSLETFTLDGRRYNEAIPGNALLAPGTKVRAVAVPGNPPLLSTRGAVATERASSSVFVVPAILLVVLAVLAGVVGVRRRKTRRSRPLDPSVTAS